VTPRPPFSLAPSAAPASPNGVGYKPEFLAKISARRAALRAGLAALLPTPRSIVWEIGCGHGHFLVRYAEEFPARLCVGVDILPERLERAEKKRDRAGLANCHFVRAEAREFLHALPADVTFEEIWILFPDPWPKARHHKHRLLQAEFFEAIAGRAEEGARLYFRTDHLEYFRAVEEVVASLQTWCRDPDTRWPLEHETVFQARAAGHHSLVTVRTPHPARAAAPVAPRLPPPEAPTLSA